MKIVSKYQMAGDAAEIDGERLKEIWGKFAMKKRAVPDEDGSISGENELSSREEKTDASVDGALSRLEKTAAQSPIAGVASGENRNASMENTELKLEKSDLASGQNATGRWQNIAPISEKVASGGMAKSGAGRQNHWDDLDMDDWCGPAKSGRAYAQGG